jgi:hypothetical protein
VGKIYFGEEKMKKILFLCLIVILLIGCAADKETFNRKVLTADEIDHAQRMKHGLEIANEGDIVKWKNGRYSIIIQVDGMPNHKNNAVKFLTGVLRDKDWTSTEKPLDVYSSHIADVFNYRESMTSGAKAIYVAVLRKAVLGIKDQTTSSD